jgi:nucleoside-diphosphate-sugar epimerase
MKTVLLTGASGFIGCNVLKLLLSEPDLNIRALVRTSSENLSHRSIMIGDIRERETVRKAVQGVDVAIHLAAFARMWSRDPQEFEQINVEGTRNVLEATQESGVGRVVFASSMSIFQSSSEIHTEANLKYRGKQLTPYSVSKMKAEMLIDSARQRGLDVVTVYPTRVFGPGPLTDANAATVALLRYRRGLLPLIEYGNQISNWAFVRDVAAGIVEAAYVGKENNSYILGGENRTLADVLKILLRIEGTGFQTMNISRNVAMRIALIEQFRAKLFHTRPYVTPEWLEMVLESSCCDITKAVNDLHYRVTPIGNALRQTMDDVLHRSDGFIPGIAAERKMNLVEKEPILLKSRN